jgi:hypothetical protein
MGTYNITIVTNLNHQESPLKAKQQSLSHPGRPNLQSERPPNASSKVVPNTGARSVARTGLILRLSTRREER